MKNMTPISPLGKQSTVTAVCQKKRCSVTQNSASSCKSYSFLMCHLAIKTHIKPINAVGQGADAPAQILSVSKRKKKVIHID